MIKQEEDNFYPLNQQEWRDWLELNHISKDSIWLIFFKKSSKTPNLSWSEAVDTALCFGWIDSTKRSIDKEKYIQYFSKRKPKSNWSKVNKIKIEKLMEAGLIKEAGLKSIEIAKQNGSWTILDAVEELIIPQDLESELNKYAGSKDYFLSLTKSIKKGILYWVISAKRPATREKRIAEVVTNANEKMIPKRFIV